MDPTNDPGRANELGRELARGWERSDFEAAVSLYVGGDLDAIEASAVEAWLSAHPEDRTVLDAAQAARAALIAASAGSGASEVDLWPSIRTHLANEGWIGAPSMPVGGGRSPEPATAERVDGSRDRYWGLQLSSAAAAALLFVGGLGWALGLGSSGSLPGPGTSSESESFAVTTELRRSAVEEHAERRTGAGRLRTEPSPGLPVNWNPSHGIARLAPVDEGAPQLLESAVPLDLGAFGPVLHSSDPVLGQGDAHSLASDGAMSPATPLRIQLGEGRFLYFEVGGR